MEIQNNFVTFATNFKTNDTMKKLKFACIAILMAAAETALAGGLLTNTNQNISFLRNPARDAAIGIDGVYYNPAGVVFLGEGIHLSLNMQNAHQTRTIETGFPLFINNADNPGLQLHKFKGEADAPVIPSLQAAWNKGKWSFQFNFAITGGGGKCEFDNGLGSFEQVVASMPVTMIPVGGTAMPIVDVMNTLYGQIAGLPGMSQHQMGKGYSYDSYMRGRQYYYGFTLGAAYKVTENLSVYGGARMLYGSSNYYGYVKNIRVEHIENGQSQMVEASKHFNELSSQLSYYAGQMDNLGQAQAAAQLKAGATLAQGLAVNTQDIELNCDQTGWGIAPIIGVDYKLGKLNLAAKYEFKTRMRLKNKSANSESAANISMLDKYADGGKVAEDSPALLTVGAQYEIIPSLRVMAGWHHYFDVDTKQYTKAMLSDTNELLAGAEYNINKYVEVSAGVQKTDYNQNDVMMNDISYNVSSWSFGLGVGVKVAKNMKVNAAYFQTNYEDYNKVEPQIKTTNCFTRTNRVIGLGLDVTL